VEGDIAQALTDSLDRNGKGGMLAPMRTTDGTVAAPSHSFTNETGSGWFRHAAGELRAAILGTYRLALTAAGAVVNGTLQAIGKLTASAGADVTGTLAVIDDGGTTKKVSIDAPTGLAADYALTLPTALPGSTLPVTLTSAGVLATGQLTNAQQNFGTPAAATDVVIKSYVDTPASAATTSAHASMPSSPNTLRVGSRVWFENVTITATGNINDCGDNGLFITTNSLFTIAAGYRPAIDTYMPISFGRNSVGGTDRLMTGYLIIYAGGAVRFHLRGIAGGAAAIANTDALFFGTVPSWTV
jgi:hypothetical protein